MERTLQDISIEWERSYGIATNLKRQNSSILSVIDTRFFRGLPRSLPTALASSASRHITTASHRMRHHRVVNCLSIGHAPHLRKARVPAQRASRSATGAFWCE